MLFFIYFLEQAHYLSTNSIITLERRLYILKVSGGITEEGIVVGNVYDKYGDSNPIVRLIMRGYDKSLTALVNQVAPVNIHEIGCGEGYWIIKWHKQGFKVRGSDVSEKVIDIAKANAVQHGAVESFFYKKSIYNMSYPKDSAELVVCCEVLEHLDDPKNGLIALSKIADPYLIVSVPREPVWSCLNIMRGKYLSNLGNTPGHLQRWSKSEFINLVSQYLKVVKVLTPLPWTMLLCRRKGN